MIHPTPTSEQPPRFSQPLARRRARSRPPAPLSAGTLVALAVVTLAAAAALALRLVRLAPPDPARLTQVDQIVELGTLAIGTLVACWLAVGITIAAACSVARLAGRRWSAGERYVAHHAPAVARRMLALSVGAGVGLTAAVLPAGAQPAEPPPDLGWTATGVVAADVETVAAPLAPAPPSQVPEQVTVAGGDSLWAIAARHLGPDATAAEIAAAWPAWYALNRDVVGANPDRIRVGDVLVVPEAGHGTGPAAAS